jgi:transposase
MPQIDLITGEPRHRSWSLEEKQSILAAAFAPGAVVRQVARRANVSTSQIYTWRRRLMGNNGSGQGGFSRVIAIADAAPPAALPPAAPAPFCELPAIELEIRRHKVRIPATMPPALAAAVVKALAGGR